MLQLRLEEPLSTQSNAQQNTDRFGRRRPLARLAAPFVFAGLFLLFCLLVFALCRNEPPPAADDALLSLVSAV